MIFDITVQKCKELLESDEVILVDVREPDEYIVEHLQKAQLVPLSVFSEKYREIEPGDKKIIFMCRSGGRSGKVCEAVKDIFGPENIYNMAGGIEEWKQLGLPVIKS